MEFLKKYYNQFRYMNPEKTQLKLIIIIVVLVSLLLNTFKKFEFSWDLVISLIVFVISMTFHEVAHGYVAYKFGDDTAKREGRLSLNPLKHLDIAGMILPLLLLLSGTKFLVGWAKPVPVNFYRLKPNRFGRFAVAVAGIVMNLFLVLISGVILYTYIINLVLAIFNLIPVTPLDGGRIIHAFGNDKVRKFYDKIEKYGMIIVFGVVYTGLFTNIFSKILIFLLRIIGINIPIEII